MNRFMIVVNPDKDTDSTVTNRIQSYLEAHGAACMVRDVFHLESSDWAMIATSMQSAAFPFCRR